MAVLNVFVGAEACCLPMITMTDSQVASSHSYKNIQNSHTLNHTKINKTINQTRAWKQRDNPYNLK
jgi:hypothetical protein